MSFDAIFANLATGFSGAFGGPYADAVAAWPGAPTYDSGGSITTPADPIELDCKCQVDAPTEAMRGAGDFVEGDARLLVLGLTSLDTSAKITIADGAHAGTWTLMTVSGDPAGIGHECRGRRV